MQSTVSLPSDATSDKLETIQKPKAMTVVAPVGEIPQDFPNAPFALLTVETFHGFIPDSPRSGFPSTANGFPEEVTQKLAEAVNGSTWARQQERWMVRTLSGGAVLLRGIAGRRRPLYPDALPAEAEPLHVESEAEARNAAAERNAERFAIAKSPRQWTVAIRNPRFGKADPLDHLDRSLRDGTLVPNPLRDELEELHGATLNALEELLPEGFTIRNGEDIVRDGDAYRAATDDEAAAGLVEIDAALPFDVRQPIAAQIAARLTEFSDQLRETAERLGRGGGSAPDAE